jgi:hypothetical protein
MSTPVLHLGSGLLEKEKINYDWPGLILPLDYVSSISGTEALESDTEIPFTCTVPQKVFFTTLDAKDLEQKKRR